MTMNDSKSKKRIVGLLGAMAFMGGLDPQLSEVTHAAREEQARRLQAKQKKQVGPPVEMTPAMMLEFLDQVTVKLARKLMDWNTTSSPKLKVFEIGGFQIKGTTIRNATKRLRRFQAECRLQPGTTEEQIIAERKRLTELVNKTTRSEEEE